MKFSLEPLYQFVFHYPLFMAFVQMSGALVYELFRKPKGGKDLNLPSYPMVSVMVPCHNEEDCIRETIEALEHLNYPNYEIIAINDSSTDRTLEILREMQQTESRLRIVNMTSNQGKGMGLTMGAMASKSEFLICIDADAILDPDAVTHMMWHFVHFPRVGAVTGNPRVRNRTSMLGKIQVGEFSSIISMIKRTQRVLGKIFTVSGVIAGFRKRALYHVGFWSNDMVTEDIDVSWKLQTRFWDIRYEPKSLCWILMPETLRGLWKQRVRWAQGGAEVLLKFGPKMFNWKQRLIWPLYIEYFLSVLWGYCFFTTLILFGLGQFVTLPDAITVKSIFPGWTGLILSVVCLLQMTIGLLIDSRIEPRNIRLVFWLIWYPMVYWLVNAFTTVAGLPRALLKKKGTSAVWVSPDRGL